MNQRGEVKNVIRIPLDTRGKQILLLSGVSVNEGDQIAKNLIDFMDSDENIYVMWTSETDVRIEFVKVGDD